MGRIRTWLAAPDIPLLLGQALAIAAIAAIRPAVSYKALDLGAGPAAIGAIAGSFALLSLFTSIPAGFLIDRHGARGVFFAGTGMICIAAVADIFTPVVVLLPVAQAMLGVGHLGVQLSSQTRAAHSGPVDARDQRFARVAVAVSAGQLAGPLAGGWILTAAIAAGLPNPTMPVFGFGLALAVLAAAVSNTDRTWGREREPSAQPDRPSGIVGVLRAPGMWPAIFTSIGVLTGIDLLIAYLPVIGEERGLSPAFVGGLLAARGAASLVSRLGLPVLIARFGRRVTLTGNLLLAGVSMAGLAVARSPLVFVPLLIGIGYGLGVGQPITAAWVSDQAPPGRLAASLALRMTGNRLGQLLLPASLGLLAGFGGPGMVFGASAVTLVGASFWASQIGLDR